MAESFSEFIEKLLAKIDLVSVVSRYVPLKRKGKTLWGCCPFHHEKEPSFTVSEEKQVYHCFGCKESGNAITFISKMESIERI
ncbi:MAG: DNA primase, partial [Clostridia bacterium]|nr:DNA primase [Clostridia bacterium]